MKIRALVVPAVLMLALAGCAPEPVVPTTTPVPTFSTPTPTPTASAAGSQLALPEDCDVLVPIAFIHSQFHESFTSMYFAADLGGSAAQSFAARDGLTCLWGIPDSDAGYVTVFAAERGTETDAQQVAQWRAAGYSECPPFMDECYFEETTDEIGEVWTVHVLVDGFELQVQATASSMDLLLVTAREAATNMGYV